MFCLSVHQSGLFLMAVAAWTLISMVTATKPLSGACKPPPLPTQYTMNYSVFSIQSGTHSAYSNESWFFDAKADRARVNQYFFINNGLQPAFYTYQLADLPLKPAYLFIFDGFTIAECDNGTVEVLVTCLYFDGWEDCRNLGNETVNGQTATHYRFLAPTIFNSTIDYWVDVNTLLPVRYGSNITEPYLVTYEQIDFLYWKVGAPPASAFTLPNFNLRECAAPATHSTGPHSIPLRSTGRARNHWRSAARPLLDH